MRYACRKGVLKEPLIPIRILHDYNPFDVCPVSLKSRTHLPIIKGLVNSITILKGQQIHPFIFRDVSWGQIMTLLWLAQYFDLFVLYTPAITYSKDLDGLFEKAGVFKEDLKYVPFNYEDNHISYVRKPMVDFKLKYDPHGVTVAEKYAWKSGKSKWVGMHSCLYCH